MVKKRRLFFEKGEIDLWETFQKCRFVEIYRSKFVMDFEKRLIVAVFIEIRVAKKIRNNN
jgi:hypothetical protein